MAQVRTVIHQGEIDRLKADPDLALEMLAIARPIVAAARSGAPKDTGAGAASIHAEAVLDSREWVTLISWDREHFYMRFHETGTRELPARPFLVPAAKGAGR